jgi:hypothetical protein
LERTEFFRRQAERFSALAEECADASVRAKLRTIAREYREMLDGKGVDGPEDRPVR